jgi:hypothetical protein
VTRTVAVLPIHRGERMKSICCLHILVLIAGCASGTASGRSTTETVRVGNGGSLNMGTSTLQDAHSRTVPAPFADVWRVLPAALDSLGVPITTRDAASGQVGTTGLEVRRTLGGTMVSRYFTCGGTQSGNSALSYDLFVILMVRAQANPAGGTALTTSMNVRGKPIATFGDWIPCESMGLLEQRIVDGVVARLAH